MKDFFLFIIATISYIILVPISILYAVKKGKGSFKHYAISIDQTINAISGPLLDSLFLINKGVFMFGDMDKTISYNLGKNKEANNLNKFGLIICWILDKIDKKIDNLVEKIIEAISK